MEPPSDLLDGMGELMGGAPAVVTLGTAPRRAYALSRAELEDAGGPSELFVLTDIDAELRAREAAILKRDA